MSKRRRGYFKHFNDASTGESLTILARRHEYLAIALWWHLVEICNQNGCGNAQVHIESLLALYNCRTKTITDSCSAIVASNANFSFNLNNSKLVFSIANYLEYQESRGQKTSKSGAKEEHIKDKRLKIKDKRYFSVLEGESFESLEDECHAFVTKMINGFTGPQQEWAGLNKDGYYAAKDILGVTRATFSEKGFRPELMRQRWAKTLAQYLGNNS